jgi:hypothetical protein
VENDSISGNKIPVLFINWLAGILRNRTALVREKIGQQ